jgi:hypothetical protein
MGGLLLALLIHSTKRAESVISSQMKGFWYDLFQLFWIAQLLTAEIYTTKSMLEGGVMEHTYKVHA